MRYKLLLLDLAHTLPAITTEEPGANEMRTRMLQRTVGQVEQVVQAVNAFTANTESSLQKVAECSNLMGGGGRFRELAGFDLVKPGRSWLDGDGEDAMWFEWDAITMRTHTKPNQLLLFNDLLVVARPSRSATHSLNYREHLPLRGMLLCHRTRDRIVLKCARKGFRVYLSEFRLGSIECTNHVGQWLAALTAAIRTEDEATASSSAAMVGVASPGGHAHSPELWTPAQARANPQVLARALYESGVLGTHKYHFGKSHQNCFAVSEAVSWMVYNDLAPTRPRCLRLGDQLVRRGFIKPLSSTDVFEDRYLLFAFTKPPPPFAPPPPPPPKQKGTAAQVAIANMSAERQQNPARQIVSSFEDALKADDDSRGAEFAALAEAEAARKRTVAYRVARQWRGLIAGCQRLFTLDACVVARYGHQHFEIEDHHAHSGSRPTANVGEATDLHTLAQEARVRLGKAGRGEANEAKGDSGPLQNQSPAALLKTLQQRASEFTKRLEEAESAAAQRCTALTDLQAVMQTCENSGKADIVMLRTQPQLEVPLMLDQIGWTDNFRCMLLRTEGEAGRVQEMEERVGALTKAGTKLAQSYDQLQKQTGRAGFQVDLILEKMEAAEKESPELTFDTKLAHLQARLDALHIRS